MRRGAHREIFGLHVLGYDATMEELKGFLLLGKDANGKWLTDEFVEGFDYRSTTKKPLTELLRELNEREAILFIHPDTGRIVRRAHSVKVILRNPEAKKELVEEAHVYHYSSVVEPKTRKLDKLFSFSETMILGETWKRTAIRCLWQEGGLRYHDLIRRNGFARIVPAVNAEGKIWREENCHESSAYPGIMSLEEIRAICYVHTNKLSPPDRPQKPDQGKRGIWSWRDYIPSEKRRALSLENSTSVHGRSFSFILPEEVLCFIIDV